MLRPLAAGRQDGRDPAQGQPQGARAYDKDLYKARHLIENFFAKLKQYRAIATRYDKRAVHFLGAIHLAASCRLAQLRTRPSIDTRDGVRHRIITCDVRGSGCDRGGAPNMQGPR